MKISHSKLEIARTDPKTFKKKVSAAGGIFRPSRYRYWQYSTRFYHKNEDDRDETVKYLAKLFNGFVQNKKADELLDKHISYLDAYIDDFKKLQTVPIEIGSRLEINIKNGHLITGEIQRVDFNMDSGYDVYVMNKKDKDWSNELRFPVIQYYYAQNIFKCEIEEVSVGVFCFESLKHEKNSYSEQTVTEAWKECLNISGQI